MSVNEAYLHAISGERCLVIEPFFQTPAVETGLEVAEILARKNSVTYLGPDRLACVTADTYRFTGRTLIRLSRKRRVSAYLSQAVHQPSKTELKGYLSAVEPERLAAFVEGLGSELGTAEHGHFDLGLGLRSSLISLTRDAAWEADPEDLFTRRLARDALVLYELTRLLIGRLDIDRVVFFNGRFATVRAIRRACESLDTRYLAHERGATLDKLALFDCAIPHLPSKVRGWVDDWWQWTDEPERQAEEFLTRRRRGVATNWFVFTRKQEQGSIPSPGARRRIVYYTSSEDEMAAIGDELVSDSPLCRQSVALEAIGTACREAGHELVVRFHPNTPTEEQELTRMAERVADIVCGPQSRVDTYALMDSADVVLTHNSTAGLEGAASGKPAFFTGRNLYEGCTAMRRLKSREEIAPALETQSPPDRTDALKYLNFLASHGIPYRYYRPRGFISGSYRGKDLNAPLSTIRDLKVRLKRGGR